MMSEESMLKFLYNADPNPTFYPRVHKAGGTWVLEWTGIGVHASRHTCTLYKIEAEPEPFPTKYFTEEFGHLIFIFDLGGSPTWRGLYGSNLMGYSVNFKLQKSVMYIMSHEKARRLGITW